MKLFDPHALLIGIYSLLIMNLVDGAFTLYWVYAHNAMEANPAMATALEAGPALFVLSKLALVFLGTYILFKRLANTYAKVGIIACCCLYALVCGLHVGTLTYWLCPYFHIYTL